MAGVCHLPTAGPDALRELAAAHREVSIHRLDVTLADDVRAIKREMAETPLDILYNNAGIYLEDSYTLPSRGAIRYDQWLRSFEVNTLGAARVTEALLDNLAHSDKLLVAGMTSHMGSIADIDIVGSYCYRSSKAALNAAMRGLAVALQRRDIGITAEESVRGLRKVIDGFPMQDSGTFIRYDGTRLLW